MPSGLSMMTFRHTGRETVDLARPVCFVSLLMARCSDGTLQSPIRRHLSDNARRIAP